MRSGRGAFTVLLAEDDARVRDFLESLLKDDGFTVECVDNGADAVRTFSLRPTDVVWLDVNMPQMNGLDALKAILAVRRTRAVVMSGNPENEAVATKAGALVFLPKPFTIAQVQRVLWTVRLPES